MVMWNVGFSDSIVFPVLENMGVYAKIVFLWAM